MQTLKTIRAVEEDELYQMQMPKADIDDSQFVTLRLESGNYLHFQVDTGRGAMS